MLRHLLVAGFAALLIAGCGSGGATPAAESPTPEVTEAPLVTDAPAPAEVTQAPAIEGATMTSLCGAVAVRKSAKTSAPVIVRIAKGAQVSVAGTVKGDAYKVGNCGTSGRTWVKIVAVDGVLLADKYGVDAGYAAAGFFN